MRVLTQYVGLQRTMKRHWDHHQIPCSKHEAWLGVVPEFVVSQFRLIPAGSLIYVDRRLTIFPAYGACYMSRFSSRLNRLHRIERLSGRSSPSYRSLHQEFLRKQCCRCFIDICIRQWLSWLRRGVHIVGFHRTLLPRF